MDISKDESASSENEKPRRKRTKKSNEFNQNQKNISINVDESKLISYEMTIKQELKMKSESVLLQHLGKRKFIEVGITLDGYAYSMIRGDLGTKGILQTRNFKTKSKAFKGAIQLLIVKLYLYVFIHIIHSTNMA